MLSGACFTASLAAFWNSGELISFSADSIDSAPPIALILLATFAPISDPATAPTALNGPDTVEPTAVPIHLPQ